MSKKISELMRQKKKADTDLGTMEQKYGPKVAKTIEFQKEIINDLKKIK